ncbi:MAG: uracil-DNA glycosylase [Paludibacteraceae bacterium]|nr:uracil-DNA glycosylase [Paludibacteraceae bacterium]
MNVRIEESWREVLQPQFDQPYFETLTNFVRQSYATTTCYPPGQKIFAAFDLCPLDKVSVVIVGQDPYHGVGQANGLSFSVNNGITMPPSLRNIFKEIATDLNVTPYNSGNLERWAVQGVFLLNATLTVEADKAGSHQNKGWEQFTDSVIETISRECEHVVFMLWGNFARRKSELIDSSKHLILQAAHPSPLARGAFFGCRHFSQANAYLQQHNKQPIDWR